MARAAKKATIDKSGILGIKVQAFNKNLTGLIRKRNQNDLLAIKIIMELGASLRKGDKKEFAKLVKLHQAQLKKVSVAQVQINRLNAEITKLGRLAIKI